MLYNHLYEDHQTTIFSYSPNSDYVVFLRGLVLTELLNYFYVQWPHDRHAFARHHSPRERDKRK